MIRFTISCSFVSDVMGSCHVKTVFGSSHLTQKGMESLRLYRRAIRLCNRLPFENVRRKSRYNVREIFDIYRNDPVCEERIRRGTF